LAQPDALFRLDRGRQLNGQSAELNPGVNAEFVHGRRKVSRNGGSRNAEGVADLFIATSSLRQESDLVLPLAQQ